MTTEFSVLVGIDSSLAKKGAREFDMAAKKVSSSADKAAKNTDQLGNSLDKSGKKGFIASKGMAAAAAGAAAFAFAATKGVKAALEFDKAMAEVSTLLDGPIGQVEALSTVVKDLSSEFAQSPTEQARALYQVISAGASDSAEAITILTEANRLAVGGVTDVATAADGLTSVLNAFGKGAADADDVSDKFFSTVKAGKTTVEELSRSLGRVAPTAAAASVSLDETLAATAALTKAGISTSQAVSGLNQSLNNILKPTKDAEEVADALGIEFNAAALESKGLAGVLRDVTNAAGGDTEALAKLFGSTEALNVALALTGGSADDFADILDNLKDSSGATQAAVDKMQGSASFVAEQFKSKLNVALIEFGDLLLTLVKPALIAINSGLDTLIAALRNVEPFLAFVGAAFVTTFEKARLAVGTFANHLRATFGNVKEFLGDFAVNTIALVKKPFDLAVDAISRLGELIGRVPGLDDLGAQISSVAKDIETFGAATERNISVAIRGATESTFDLTAAQNELETSVATNIAAAKDMRDEVWRNTQAQNALKDAQAATTTAIEEQTKAAEKAERQRLQDIKAAQALVKAQRDVRKKMDDVLVAQNATGKAALEHARAVRELTLEMIAAKVPAEEMAAVIEAMNEQHDERITKLDAECEKTNALAECNKENSDEIQAAWNRAAERIDDTFANLFRSAFDGFESLADSLKDTFKSLLSELALAAIRNPILMKMGIAGGGAGAIGSANGGILGSLGGFGQTIGTLAGGAALGSLGGSLTGGSSGIGAAGGAIGAAIGNSILPGLGGLIGGFLGGAVGGALFGGEKKLKAAGVNLGISGGQLTGDSFETIKRTGGLLRSSKTRTKTSALGSDLQAELQGAIDDAFGAVTGIAEALGTSGVALNNFALASQKLDLKGLSEDEAAAKIEDFLQGAIGQGIEFFVDNTEGLSDRLKNTVNRFRGNSDDLIAAFEAAASIDLALALNPIEAAGQLIADQNRSLNDIYQIQVKALNDLVNEYDGSLESLQNLAGATQAVKQSQTELAFAFLSLRDNVSDLFGGTAQSIREALLSEQELFDLRQSQVDELVAQLNTASSPDEIARISEDINRATLESFNLLDEGQQSDMQAGFLTFLDEVTGLANQRIDAGLASLDADASRIDQSVSTQMLQQAAETQRIATDRFGVFVERFGQFIGDRDIQRSRELGLR